MRHGMGLIAEKKDGFKYNFETSSRGSKLRHQLKFTRNNSELFENSIKNAEKGRIIKHRMKSHKRGNQLHSALKKGFVTKSSERMVQKMATKGPKDHFNKAAFKSTQFQSGQGQSLVLQGTTGNGFAQSIFPKEDKVNDSDLAKCNSKANIVHSELHLLDDDLGHIFVAKEGTVKQKGLSSQKYVVYSQDKGNKKGGKVGGDFRKPDIVVMKKKENEITSQTRAKDGMEIINREGELFIKEKTAEKDKS